MLYILFCLPPYNSLDVLGHMPRMPSVPMLSSEASSYRLGGESGVFLSCASATRVVVRTQHNTNRPRSQGESNRSMGYISGFRFRGHRLQRKFGLRKAEEGSGRNVPDLLSFETRLWLQSLLPFDILTSCAQSYHDHRAAHHENPL
ncbi:hypothetical protein AC579_3307 [Pseudocercospora musae]|uniref:Uncharacterized protein n=1 Tax=Pseudocercospora musae TaxID=113226 RepID=A0A139I9N4_9PEZI|nr:hypothetical protein AC579_3307 [Pseudocercospora musae]